MADNRYGETRKMSSENQSPRTGQKITCYSEKEQDIMDQSQQIRGRLFSPLLTLLIKLGVRPNHLTFLSLLCGIGFFLLFPYSRPGALALLAMHVFLDGLDGPLARKTGTASNKGSFTDTTADQIVVALSTLSLVYFGHLGVIPGGLYVFLYTMVVIFAMVRSGLAIPYSWVVRPRFYVFAWIPVELYVFPGTMNYLVYGFCILLAAKMITGFIQIRKKL